jgi:hypothetical protein
MELELKNLEGKKIGTIEFPVESLARLNDSSTSSAALAEKDAKITDLEGQVATLSSDEHNQEIVTKALEQFKDNPELYMEVGRQMGLDVQVIPAEAAEAPKQELEFCEGEGDPKEGWKYHSLFGMSSRVKPQEA